MIWIVIALIVLVLSLLPAVLFSANLRQYRPPPPIGSNLPAVSILIPARNEEQGIEAAVRCALASRGIEVEVLVLDDASQDATAAIVRRMAHEDARVRLEEAPQLPLGWAGKQHACWVLAQRARHPLLLFLDADVRLEPEGAARLAAFLTSSGASLVSGVPRQITHSFLEYLLIPLIHFVLLGFLPLGRMRRSTAPAYAAGCGQLFLTERSAYEKAGGHAAIRTTFHDGIRLPRAFRTAGFATDLCDATEVASCRMYQSAKEVWRGLSKNAHEGLGSPGTLGPATFLLLGGQVLPSVLLFFIPWMNTIAIPIVFLSWIVSYWPRLLGIHHFGQSWRGGLLHPLGVFLLVVIQWQGFLGHLFGWRTAWKGRAAPHPQGV